MKLIALNSLCCCVCALRLLVGKIDTQSQLNHKEKNVFSTVADCFTAAYSMTSANKNINERGNTTKACCHKQFLDRPLW
jgi:hypothetical protein